MRKILLILICFILTNQSYSQHDSLFFFREFSFSINRTSIFKDFSNDRFGFGFGIHGSLFEKHKTNLRIGLELNRTTFFAKKVYDSHLSYLTDITYTLNSLSIPITIRHNLGEKLKYFIEYGLYCDLALSSKEEGTIHIDAPNQHSTETYKTDNSLERNLGISLGLGLRIPTKKHGLFILTDYKFGFGTVDSYNDSPPNCYLRLIFEFRF
jgi:hypothetical protein